MAAAEEEEKEDIVAVVELKGLIFIWDMDVFLLVGEQENDGLQLQTTDLVSTLTTATPSDVPFIKLCFVLEKLRLFPSTSEDFVSILAQFLSTTAPEAPSGNESDGSLKFDSIL